MDHSVDAAVSEIVGLCAIVSKALLQGAAQRPEAGLDAVEAAARDAGQTLAQALLTAALGQHQRYEPAPPCRHCGGPTMRHEARERGVLSLVGPLAVPLLSFRCPACGRTTPGALRAALVHGCTPGLAQRAARQGVLGPFREAEQTLADFGLSVSDNLVADLTRAVGDEVLAAQAEEAAQVAAGTVELAPAEVPQRLYLEIDSFKVQVVDTGARRGRPGSDWHEVRCGACFTTAAVPPDARGQPPRPEGFSCRASWADCDTFDRWFYPEVQRRGVNQAAEVVTLMDGAPWQREHLRRYVPPGTKLVEILDWYHATENLAKAAKARYSDDSGASAAAWEALKSELWEGRPSGAVRLLAGWLRAGDRGAKEVRQVVGYLWANRARMRYPRYRAAGYHIGSGQIESLCKQLGARVKGADRLWCRAGLEPVLAYRCQLITEQHQYPRAA